MKRLASAGLFSPLFGRTYRHLFFAQALSLTGTGLATIALALLAYDLAGDRAGVVLGTALAIKMIAYVGLAPLAADLAQRFPRRAFLVTLDIVRALIVLALPFVTEVWQVYVLIFVLQAASAAFTPAFRATIPDILPDERDFTRALSLSRIAYDLEALLSPSIAAALLAVMSFHWLFAGTAIGFVVSALLVVSVPLPGHAASSGGDSYRQRLGRGLYIYLRTPRLRGVLAVQVAVAAAGAMAIVNTVVLVRDRFGGDAGDVALMMAAIGCGSVLMTVFLPAILDRVSERGVMLVGAVFLVACMAAGTGITSLPGGGLVWLALGAASSAAQTPTERLLRKSASDEDRPRLYAAQFSLSHACWLVAYPLAGWLGGTLGLQVTFMLMALLALAGFVLALRLWPAVDPLELPHDHPAERHAHWHVHDEHHQHEHDDWDGVEPHTHVHTHSKMRHSHAFVIDRHHSEWPI